MPQRSLSSIAINVNVIRHLQNREKLYIHIMVIWHIEFGVYCQFPTNVTVIRIVDKPYSVDLVGTVVQCFRRVRNIIIISCKGCLLILGLLSIEILLSSGKYRESVLAHH